MQTCSDRIEMSEYPAAPVQEVVHKRRPELCTTPSKRHTIAAYFLYLSHDCGRTRPSFPDRKKVIHRALRALCTIALAFNSFNLKNGVVRFSVSYLFSDFVPPTPAAYLSLSPSPVRSSGHLSAKRCTLRYSKNGIGAYYGTV